MVEAGDFPDELQGSGAHLFRRNRLIEIEERFDVAAHRRLQSEQWPVLSGQYKRRGQKLVDVKYFA
jgi:hypothetical protein